jgi:hypothetical protein
MGREARTRAAPWGGYIDIINIMRIIEVIQTPPSGPARTSGNGV